MAEPQKHARRQQATLVFIDESGFRLRRLIVACGRHVASAGATGLNRNDRLSVITAVTRSPQRQQINTPFAMRSRNIVTTDVVNFTKRLRRQLRRPLILILDRWSVHRAAVKRLPTDSASGLELAWPLAYAAELNHVESF